MPARTVISREETLASKKFVVAEMSLPFAEAILAKGEQVVVYGKIAREDVVEVSALGTPSHTLSIKQPNNCPDRYGLAIKKDTKFLPIDTSDQWL